MAGDLLHVHDRAAAHLRVGHLFSAFSLKSLKVSLLATTAICAVMVLARPASAQSPTGGSVVAGTAGISQAGPVTNINQSSQKAIINWQGFSVGAQNTVNFNQPNSSSATLNRVIGNERSVIDGAINANGQVFIVNSAGVLFGKGSQVNVGGLVASTLDISNNDFMAGNYKFSGTSSASVVNQGRIRAHGGGQGGGYVALLGKTVSNEGMIAAKLGTVAMAAGEKVTLNFGGDSLLDVTIDKGTLNALVSNKRAIIADGGQVIMTAKAADQVLSAQVNNSGIIQARTMAALKGGSNGGTVRIGKIKLLAQGGTTNVSGKLDASAPKGGDGGFIETSGDVVNIADSAVITTAASYGKTGTWLIDPNDFTVAASGGNMTGAAVAAALLSNNFEIATATMGTPGGNGDIFINDAITWASNNTLTLTAERDININQAITATGASAGLVFTAANNININNAVRLDGASATLAMAYGGNYNIRTPASYAGTTPGLVTDKDGNPVYEPVLVQKINPPLDTTKGTKATYGAPAPGEPVYDADGNPVYELVQGDQATGPVAVQDTSGGVYGSITLSNSANTFSTNPNGLTINGQIYHLVHSMNDLVSAANTAPGGFYALGGNLDPTTDSGSTYTFSTAPISTLTGALDGLGHTITGLKIAGTGSGGLVGTLGANGIPSASISNLGLVNVDISAASFTGSFVGLSWGRINNVYATGKVLSTGSPVGGIVGINQLGFVTNAHADVKVTGLSEVGGLVGRNVGNTAGNNGIIADSSATGSINATFKNSTVRSMFGGLVGRNSGGAILRSYATGAVLPLNNPDGTPIAAHVHNNNSSDLLSVGGLVGSSGNNSVRVAKIEDSFATGDVTSADAAVGGLVGGAQSTDIRRSYATGNVYATSNSSKTWAGGLVGWFTGAAVRPVMEDSFATGDVTAPGVDYVGGLVGRNDGTITRSFATGNVIGRNNVGGFVGQNFWVIASSFATGDVTGSGFFVGGFVGFNNPGNSTLVASITGSSAAGNVTGASGVGGFAGMNGTVDSNNGNGRLDGVTALGNVTSTNGQAGGLVGYNAGEIAHAVATGDVSGGARTGGLVGWNDGTTAIIRDSYATGSITNPGGGLIGENTSSGSITNSTYDDVKAKAREAAAAQAAAQAADRQAALAQGVQGVRSANAVSNDAQTSSVTPPDPATANAGAAAAQSAKTEAMDNELKAVDDKAKADDAQRERRRTAQTSRRSHAGSGSGGGLGATIRSIDVNGQRFDLQNDAPKPDAPAQAPQ